ncbi:MAG: RagB/SusD family nutrient uptake outer membrane protein [Parabacteroides sp.]|jgi:starch-binding outer membrane protein, SusD/RagB family|nr:RagB/SusD family nutrient uptake outer membrane protein [Parabacteroides sp.]
MKLNFLKYSAVAVVFLASLSGCQDLDLAPTDKFTEANYWTSAEKASMVLNTAYGQLTSSGRYFSNESLSDNMYEGRGNSSEKMISSGQADASNSRFSEEWKNSYAGIKTCNVFLENVDKVPNMNETLRTRMKAEARFIRAWLYLQLTTWYGDVLLFEKDITLEESKSISRTPKAAILTFIYNELDEVEAVLPTNTEYAEADRGRITKGAAIALKARAYLYQNDWANVVAACEKLIGNTSNGTYALFSSYEGIFKPENEYNSEVILDYQYVPSVRVWEEMYDLAPLSVGARINSKAPTQELVDDYIMMNGKSIKEANSGYDESNPYKNRDPRFAATIVYHGAKWVRPDGTIQTIYIKPGSTPSDNTYGNVDEYIGAGSNSTSTGYYLRKNYDPTSEIGMKSGLNLILIRYADVLLMYAEAMNELGKMDEAVWNKTIRPLRERAGFTDAPSLIYPTEGNMQTIIRRERRVELAMEGLRIFDIRRWKTAENVLNGYPHGAQFGEASIDNGYIRLEKRTFNPERDYLWAVPLSQKDLNPNLGQNPGY